MPPFCGRRIVVGMGQFDRYEDNRTSKAAPLSAVQAAPIAGVDLATYAWVVKQVVPIGFDRSLLPGIAARRGIGPTSWKSAMDGWVLRLQEPTVAAAFRHHYCGS